MSNPSPSTVAYLFADRFVLSAKPGETGQKAFGTGGIVNTKELAAGLVAIAIWQLREMGAVTLQAYHSKKLGFIATSGARVTLVGEAQTGGVEQRCLDQLARSGKSRTAGMSAWDVANFVCRDGRDPHGVVIRIAMDAAVEAGCLTRVDKKLDPVPEALQTLGPAVDALAAQWREFRQGEEELAKLLRTTIYEGIDVQSRRRDD